MVLVSPPDNGLDSVVSDGVCHIFDHEKVDPDAPASENQHNLASDVWFNLGEVR